MNKSAVVLLSGGIDSAVCLALAKQAGYACYALSFNYGQKQLSELKAAEKIAQHFAVTEHQILTIPRIRGSALTESDLSIPEVAAQGINTTYVPARNTIFLSYALAWAEHLKATSIFYGANAPDFSGFPDCRPAYIAAFETMANLATEQGVAGEYISIQAPLVHLSKADIIKLALSQGVLFEDTVTCYQADEQGYACGNCGSCCIRRQGFIDANISDPTKYVNH